VILVVDDETALRRILRVSLSASILLDLGSPSRSGIDVTRRVRESRAAARSAP